MTARSFVAVCEELVDPTPSASHALTIALQTWRGLAKTARARLDAVTQSHEHVAFVFDIEGTTTPLPFVTQVLYPASERLMEKFLDTHYPTDPVIADCVASAAAQEGETTLRLLLKSSSDPARIRAAFADHTRALIRANSKAPHLKTLQGRIWAQLYLDGVISGHLFEDTPDAWKRWANTPVNQTSVWTYSSGSIDAQKLLFGYSTHGDFTGLLSGYFDPSTVGPKVEAKSYCNLRQRVVQKLGFHDGQAKQVGVVFFTDSLAEVAAAQQSGAVDLVFLMLRPLNAPLGREPETETGVAQRCPCCLLVSFDQLHPESLQFSDAAVADKLSTLRRDVKPYLKKRPPLKAFL